MSSNIDNIDNIDAIAVSSPIVYQKPKGTKDYTGKQQYTRRWLIENCRHVFEKYDAQETDTPIFELSNVLMSKNPDMENQTFHIQSVESDDDGTENTNHYTLRYDQTVPFSRYIKESGVVKMRRYQIGKVFRKDQPNMKAGRFREFIQCDYDCLGNDNDVVSTDVETLSMAIEILRKSLYPPYMIRINTKPILSDLLTHCKVPDFLQSTVCSSIDKLDKRKWSYVARELSEKGLDDECILCLQHFLDLPLFTLQDIVNMYNKDTSLSKLSFIQPHNVKYLLRFAELFETYNNGTTVNNKQIRVDIGLARGLNYYTGIIFEIVLSPVGSIAGGGRYDELCNGINCIGFSIGIDRILSVIAQQEQPPPKVLIVQTPDKNPSPEFVDALFKRRIQLLGVLRNDNISATTEMRPVTGLGNQMKIAVKRMIPYVVFVGEKELKNDTVTLKCMKDTTQSEMKLHDAISIIRGAV